MAEYVEQRMEEMVPELEELERVQLLTKGEVKSLMNKRKGFEYKIQKRTKQKEDFLSYIQYETNLLDLIKIRREKTGYLHKKGVIEHAVVTRVNKLFKIMEHRFQSDVKIWLSHIEFLKKVKWSSSVSKVFLRLLQIHNDKPNLWLAAAKWEMEEAGSPENGRQIMLRGLRFHPENRLLHREYFRLELLYVERLRKRIDVLSVAAAMEDVAEENRDDVLNCAVALVVYRNAAAAVKCPKFLVSLLGVARLFPFASNLADEILEDLRKSYPGSPAVVDTLARMKLSERLAEKDAAFKDGLADCVEVYEAGLAENAEDTEELLALYLETLLEVCRVRPADALSILGYLVKCLERGMEKGLLTERQYCTWLQIVDSDDQARQARTVLESANKVHPQSVRLWTKRVALELKEADTDKALEVFKTAVKSLGEGSDDEFGLWKLMLANLVARGKAELAEELLQQEMAKVNLKMLGGLRVLLLEQVSNRGIEATREVYYRLMEEPPFHLELHQKMLQLEEEQEGRVSSSHVRKVHEAASRQFGRTSPNVWLSWIKFELSKNKPMAAAELVCRAEATLEEHLVTQFVTLKHMHNIGLQ